MRKPELTVIVPCFNEEAVLPETIRRLTALLESFVAEELVDQASNLLFVDDGSTDRTWAIIREANGRNPRVAGLKLSRNVGHQKALLAGLEAACGQADCIISIDADLQDDVDVMRAFLAKHAEGFDVVYGVRKNRNTDTWFKRTSASLFYRFMNRLGIGLIPHHADYRLLSGRALAELCRYRESNLFLRGIVPLIGFSSAIVYYDRKERFAGQSKYPLRRMLGFAFDGISSFSVAPIRWVTGTGFLILLISLAAGLYALLQKWSGHATAGWTSLMLSVWMLGGLQLMGIGLIGEYIGKIFMEVKNRPKYAIDTDLYRPALERLADKSADGRPNITETAVCGQRRVAAMAPNEGGGPLVMQPEAILPRTLQPDAIIHHGRPE